MKKIFVLFFLFSASCFGWTWVYKKKFDLDENVKSAFFNKKTHPYKQLIFSWNAFRPQKGYFRFFVKIHTPKGWSKWFNMVDWGAKIQKSYLDKEDNDSGYYHVRLETPNGQLADAFRIKVESFDEADLTLLKMISVSVADKDLFKPETFQDLKDLKSVFINKVPVQSQMLLKHEDNKYMCSPTSFSMLLGYLTQTKLDPLCVAKNCFDDGLKAYGSWPFNTAHAFEVCPKCNFSVVRLSSFRKLHEYLQKGVPVVVSIRGNLKGAAKDYPNGHLVLVIGWSKEKRLIYVCDPAFNKISKVKHAYDVNEFLRAWERSHRLSYVVDC